jgi:methyl-accepting chemotaxis protein
MTTTIIGKVLLNKLHKMPGFGKFCALLTFPEALMIPDSPRGFRLRIFHKVALLGALGFLGMSLLGGVGYRATHRIDQAARTSLEDNANIRAKLVRTYDQALASQEQARILGDLNRRLIELQQSVVAGQRQGLKAGKILDQARQLAKDALIVNQVPGSDRLIEGTKQTLGEVTVANFEDVVTLLEYELPDLYGFPLDSPEHRQKLGEISVSLASTYFFISRNIKDLADKSLARVTETRSRLQGELETAATEALSTRQDLAVTTAAASYSLISIFALTLILLGAFFVAFARSLVLPLQRTVAMARDLQRGRVATRLPDTGRSDEFGSMARALNEFADNLEHDIVGTLQQMGNGDFSRTISPRDSQDKLRTALQMTAREMSSVLGEIQTASEQIANNSVQISDSSQILSQGASESAASLEEISASMSQIAGQTRQSSKNADQAQRLAEETCDLAKNGNRQMGKMVAAMSEIDAAGKSIRKIIKVIDEIAFQTNLLALNAAVEAARAGQHGKGFAIVAEEVRNLASRSSKAAQETTTLIESSVQKTANGSAIAAQTARALAEIVASIAQVANLSAEIADAGKQQTEGIDQVNLGLGQIDQVIQQNTAGAEESAATSEELSAQALQMKGLLQRFKLAAQDRRPEDSKSDGGAPQTRLSREER